MADIQGRLPDCLREVHARFGDGVELFIADNRDRDHPQIFKGWDNIDVLQSEGNHEQIRQRLEEALERQRGHLGEAAYRQASGLAPLDSVHDRSMAPKYDGGVQAPEQGRSLPEGSGETPVLTEGEPERLQIARAVAEKVVDEKIQNHDPAIRRQVMQSVDQRLRKLQAENRLPAIQVYDPQGKSRQECMEKEGDRPSLARKDDRTR